MNGHRDARARRARSQTTAVIFLFAQTHSIQCSVLAHALVCTGRGNSTPPSLFHSPCRGLINGVRPSWTYLLRFLTVAPEMCLSMTWKGWIHFRFYPMKQIHGSPAFVFLVMNDCVHSNTPTNQQQEHVGDHAPTKIPWLALCADWFEIWRGVASCQRSVYKYKLSVLPWEEKN